MLIFGSGMSSAACAVDAAREAFAKAIAAFGEEKPKLGVVFGSMSYADLAAVPDALRALGDFPIVGGSGGGTVLGPTGVAERGVSLVLLGGDGIEVRTESVAYTSPELVDLVPAAARLASAADEASRAGHGHFTCLVFGPNFAIDGEMLVAAVRKGAGVRAQLAGGLTGDERGVERPVVFGPHGLRDDQVVLAGLYTVKPVGIAARHGFHPVGPSRVVTRADGRTLYELDGRPAAEVWLSDIRKLGVELPEDRGDLLRVVSQHYPIGIVDPGKSARMELVARAPWAFPEDGTVELGASIGEGRRVRVLHATRNELLRASTDAAAGSFLRAGSRVAGALVLACTGRLGALGHDFPEESAMIRNRVGAPIGGACVHGEVAKNGRDADAFFNTTTVVVAFAH